MASWNGGSAPVKYRDDRLLFQTARWGQGMPHATPAEVLNWTYLYGWDGRPYGGHRDEFYPWQLHDHRLDGGYLAGPPAMTWAQYDALKAKQDA